jgi:hypothetical protein
VVVPDLRPADASYGSHLIVRRSRGSGLPMPVAGRSRCQKASWCKRWGPSRGAPLEAAHTRRRTFASGILPDALCVSAALRRAPIRRRRIGRGCACSHSPAPGYGQPLAASSRSTGFQPVCLPGSHWARRIIGLI